MAKVISANSSTGLVTIDRLLLHSYAGSPVAADVTQYQVDSITINGGSLTATTPFGLLEVKGFNLTNMAINSIAVGGNTQTIFSANYVQDAVFDNITVQGNGASCELPQRASNNIEIKNSKFVNVSLFAFGEYGTIWRIHDNTISLAPDNKYFVGSAGLDVEWRNNDIRIPKGGPVGITDYLIIYAGDLPTLLGRTRIVNNLIDCSGLVGDCLKVTGPDTVVVGNTIRGNIHVTSPGSGVAQASSIVNNDIDTTRPPFAIEAASCICLNSAPVDGASVTGNTCTGANTAKSIGIDIVGQPGGDSGGHTVEGNNISGYPTPIAYNSGTNPGTTICCNAGSSLLVNMPSATAFVSATTGSGLTMRAGKSALSSGPYQLRAPEGIGAQNRAATATQGLADWIGAPIYGPSNSWAGYQRSSLTT